MSHTEGRPNPKSGGLAVTGFVVGLASILLLLVPFLDLLLGITGLVFSIIGLARRARKVLAVVGVVSSSIGLLAGMIVTIIFVTMLYAGSNASACVEFESKLVPVTATADYMTAEITTQNLTGDYDFDAIRREATVLETQVNSLSDIEGNVKFNAARSSVVASMKALAQAMQRAGESGFADDAKSASADVKTALDDIQILCQ